ncbi:MAG: hypothetical protein JXR56_04815 [Candidatus Cloacimonetes bacterium]|nr:hypothetical protein [Candidatus Cloacimonadota bacterium]
MALNRKVLLSLLLLIANIIIADELPVFIKAEPVKELMIVVQDDDFIFPNPPTIRVIMTVEPDSTVTYVDIITKAYKEREDWKAEMMTWKFKPALMDSVAAQSNEYFDVKLISKDEFNKILARVEFQPAKIKEEMIEYAVRHRKRYYDDLAGLNPGVYTSNLHFAAPTTEDVFIDDDNYSVLASAASPLHRIKTEKGTSYLDRTGFFYEFKQEYYPYQPALTTIYAGIGENDHNIANISFMKNNSLGLKNLLVRADMHFEYGYWGNSVETTGNTKVSSIYRSALGDIKLSFSSINQKIPSHNIMPVYGLGTFSSATEKGRTVTVGFDSGLVLLGYKSESLQYSSDVPEFKLKSDIRQYLAGLHHETETWQAKLSYQFVERDANYDVQELYQDSPDSKHITSFTGNCDFGIFSLKEQAVYKHTPQLYLSQTELNIPLVKWLGLTADYLLSDRDKPESGTGKDSLNYRAYFEDYTEAHTKQIVAGGFDLNLEHFKLKTIVGTKTTYNFQQTIQGDDKNVIEPEETGLYADIDASVLVKLFQWNVTLKGNTIYQQKLEELQYYPEWQSRFNLDFVKPMISDNALKTGIQAIYVSDYNNEIRTIPEYLVYDYYFGFQISRIFEFRGYMKNVLNERNVMGRDILPRTYLAEIQWYFLN